MRQLAFALVVLATTSLAAGGPVAAQSQKMPAHASCSFDREAVSEYVPEYELSHLDIQPDAVYAARFSSSERETNVYVYWALYPYQAGFTSEDSHAGDHEPVYVVVDDSTGEIERVQFSAYHYLKGTTLDPPMNETNHPQMYVHNPYHHYTPRSLSSGETPDLRNFCTAYESWFANGWEASPEAVLNPWSMQTRGHWWAEGDLGVSLEAIKWQIQRQLANLVGVAS